jgi:hypothetical protein
LKDEISRKILLKKLVNEKQKEQRKKMCIKFDRKKKLRRMKFEKQKLKKKNPNQINSN